MDDQEEFRVFLRNRAHRNSTDQKINLSFLERASQCSTFADLSLNVLSPVLFGSQRMFFQYRAADSIAVTPYVVHFNWLKGALFIRHKGKCSDITGFKTLLQPKTKKVLTPSERK